MDSPVIPFDVLSYRSAEQAGYKAGTVSARPAVATHPCTCPFKHKTSKNKYQGDKTDETYRLPNGAKSSLPIYYRNKIYTDEEKEKLWLNKLDKQERYINGTKISVKNGEELYYKVLKTAQETNKRLGYGDRGKDWDKKEYNVTLNKIRSYERTKKEFEKSAKNVLNNLKD